MINVWFVTTAAVFTLHETFDYYLKIKSTADLQNIEKFEYCYVMSNDEKKKPCSQAKRIFTRVGKNLEKSLESRYNKFKDALSKVQRKHGKYMKHVTEQSDEEWINSLSRLKISILKSWKYAENRKV